jgi:uncharacterized protein (TIGR02145 family)
MSKTVSKFTLAAGLVLAMAFFLSCSEDLKPIERETLADDQRTLQASSSSGGAANLSSSGEAASSSSSGEAANPSSSSEAANPSSSSGEEQKPAVSGVSQKGPFLNNSSVTLYELGSDLVQTGRSFHGTTDNKGSFEIKGIELASPYALLKADGFYRNEVTGGNSSAPITLYAIADMSNKSNANVNILTHLEYYRVQTLVQKGKSLAAAKRQAMGEILAVFSIDGSNFSGSEDMSIFGTSDSDAALLAISILLQGELSEGSFLALLADFSQKLKDSGVWDNKTMKAEMADWASSADLVAIRGNIAGWGLSESVPDFEKYIRSYAEANSGTGGCIGLDSENEFCHNGYVHPKCGDENGKGKHEYDPVTQFCHNNYTIDKCGGKVFEPPGERCNYGVIEKQCGANWYDPSQYYCYNGSLSSCGSLPLDPDTQFCSGSTRYDKCGGTVTFAPETEACCGSEKYTLATHSCHNGQTYSCGNLPYDPATHFCLGSAITPLCGGQAFTGSQFCSGNTVYGKCGGTVTFAPGTEACCGSSKYTLASQFCSGSAVYEKCGGTVEYAPGTEACCGSNKYTLATHFCLGSTATPLCGGRTFTSSQFCSNYVRYDKCGGTVEYAPGTEACCGSGKYALATHFCHNGQTYSCGNKPYDPAMQFCSGGTIYSKCDGSDYNPSTQYCSDVTVKTYGTFIDIRNEKTYKSIVINNQTWMVENLNYNASGSVCYENNSANCSTYGRLYDWSTAMGLDQSCNTSLCASQVQAKHKGVCPTGWHIPSKADWDALMSYIDGVATGGKKLKAISGWNSNGNGTNDYGFSALPGGYGDSDGSFSSVGNSGNWWDATEYNASYAYRESMFYNYNYASNGTYNKSRLLQVRCVQD